MKVTEVVAALIWDKDRFMICQRPAHKARGLLWEFVGGKVEPNETKKEALVRECKEELNIEVEVKEQYMMVLHQYPDLLVNLSLFNCSIKSGEIELLEHNDLAWITVDEIDKYDFCPADEDILERLKKEERKYVATNSDGQDIYQYTIKDEVIEVSIITYGADITRLIVDNKDVVLGYNNIQHYFDNGPHLGSTIFPSGNRIAKGKMNINGIDYSLVINNNGNNLHSHPLCDKRIYDVVEYSENSLTLKTMAYDLEDYFPGNREFTVKFSCENGALKIEYSCISDKDTIFNPTQHSYFNLNGHDGSKIYDHSLWLNSDYITETDKDLVPNGNYLSIRNTAMDFTVSKKIGKDINSDFIPMVYGSGYDHNYCINDYDGSLRKAASLSNGVIKMDVFTTMPGIQVYTANFLGEKDGKYGVEYTANCAVALETQYYPDNIHHSNFPSALIKANKKVNSTTIYQFTKENED